MQGPAEIPPIRLYVIAHMSQFACVQVFEYIMQSLANYRQMHMRMQQLANEGLLDGSMEVSYWMPARGWWARVSRQHLVYLKTAEHQG